MEPESLIVLAKAPRAGFSKTRLCPPCTYEQAAALAEAALSDTLDAVLAAACDRRVLVFDPGPSGVDPRREPWWRTGFEVIFQGTGGLDRRLARAFGDVGGPAFLVAMDTPQITAAHLDDGLAALRSHQSAIGFTEDGGYWGIGLRIPRADVFDGVPMSRHDTGAAQQRRMHALGLSVKELGRLRDVDLIDDAVAVSADAPGTRFAGAMRSFFGA